MGKPTAGLLIRNPHKAPNGQNCCGPHMDALCGSWLDSGYSVSVSVLVRLTPAAEVKLWSAHLKRLWIDVIVNMFCDWVNALFVKKKQTEMAVISHHHQWSVHSLKIILFTGIPSLEEKKALPNCDNKDGNMINILKHLISISVASVLKCMKRLYPYVQVISVWWWVCLI